MCYGVPILANNDKAVYGKGTSSHTTTCEQLKLNEDQWIKYEYHWWDKQLIMDHYDPVGEDIIAGIDRRIAEKHATALVQTHFRTQKQLIEWLKDNKDEWGRLLEHGSPTMIKAVCPALADYNKKIKSFKVSDKTNPYQAENIPDIKTLKKALPKKVRDQVGDQVWNQVGDQVRNQVGDQVRNQVRDQVRNQVRNQVWDQVWNQVGDQVWNQVGDQVRNQVGDQVWNQVRNQVWDQVWNQVGATSYWAVKMTLGLPIKHWFFDFLKLGVMVVFVHGKVKVFGKGGKYLGEYDESEFN